ncbi:hypothetical protein GOBAR_DD08101 [Gossypium barbadense]|nr:hypothetical protein GOBAR_DD08101 [Gossypium barbadense]
MQTQNLSFSKTLNPPFLLFPSPKPCLFASFPRQNRPFLCQYPPILSVHHRDIRAFSGRSKKKPGGQSSGRLEGNSEIRRVAGQNTRRKQKNRYGEFVPYSWRGVVVGEPIRGWFWDERVTMIGEVKNHEEWEKIEQFEMASEFGKRPEMMDRNVGFRYCWVFVRHPKWRINELPWEQWTLVSEVFLEAKKTERLDKWSLMGRLGNKARSLITQCAAWMRPDIIYVKKPVYQCRFEGQDEFFNALIPFLDSKTERDFLFEYGSVEMCSYFEGLCKIVKVNQKSFVDDVVKGFEKLSEEGKSRCLGFLLGNHPLPLLHPYTKEWKAKLEEMELGCDAPDDDEDVESGEMQFTDWVEDDYGGRDDDDDDGEEAEDQDNVEEFQKALSSSDRMEKLVKRSVEVTTEFYNEQLAMQADSSSSSSRPRG